MGTKLTITGNNPVWCPELNCYRRVDELNGDEKLLVFNKPCIFLVKPCYLLVNNINKNGFMENLITCPYCGEIIKKGNGQHLKKL